MKEIRIIIIVLALGIFASGCVKEQPKPEIPPSSSFVLEIDNIWNNSPEPMSLPGISSKSNFFFGAGTIFWWNTVLSVQMVIPVAAYLEAFNHVPVWDKTDISWVWSYTMDVQSTSYTAELFAETINDEVHWSMYMSKSDGYTDFLWFTGISKTDNSSGSWSINKNPENNKEEVTSIPYLDILWSIAEDGTSEITYTNIEDGSADKGNYIKYGIVDDPDLDAFYDIYRTWEENLVSLKWNTTLHYGRVLSMAHFKDPYWHCWNENFENIICE